MMLMVVAAFAVPVVTDAMTAVAMQIDSLFTLPPLKAPVPTAYFEGRSTKGR
jgi:hypothetical protein